MGSGNCVMRIESLFPDKISHPSPDPTTGRFFTGEKELLNNISSGISEIWLKLWVKSVSIVTSTSRVPHNTEKFGNDFWEVLRIFPCGYLK